MHIILDAFEFQPLIVSNFLLSYNGKVMAPCLLVHFYRIIIKVACSKNMQKSLNWFEYTKYFDDFSCWL